MNNKKKIFFTILILLIPVIVFAQGGHNQKVTKIWDFLLNANYIVGFIFALIGIGLIWAKKLNNTTRILQLLIAFLLFGVFIEIMHPSPVCSFTKPFIFGLRSAFLACIIFIVLLSLISSKGFCGTICQAGALQELFYKIPIFKKIKRSKVPFVISNAIRIIIAILFFVLVYTITFNIYDYLSFFNLFHWYFALPFTELITFIVIIGAILIASLYTYRPFCYFICPIGLVTWILEQLPILKVRIELEKCTDCGICEVKAPCNTVVDLMKDKKIRSDCHLCGACINDCPEDAFYFGLWKSTPTEKKK